LLTSSLKNCTTVGATTMVGLAPRPVTVCEGDGGAGWGGNAAALRRHGSKPAGLSSTTGQVQYSRRLCHLGDMPWLLLFHVHGLHAACILTTLCNEDWQLTSLYSALPRRACFAKVTAWRGVTVPPLGLISRP
jgi:hypothetical protein